MGYFGQWSVNLCQSGQNSLAGIFHVWVMIYTGTDPGWEPAWYTILGRIVYPYPQLEATVDNGKTIRKKRVLCKSDLLGNYLLGWWCNRVAGLFAQIGKI